LPLLAREERQATTRKTQRQEEERSHGVDVIHDPFRIKAQTGLQKQDLKNRF
jgi:hypothetical protein